MPQASVKGKKVTRKITLAFDSKGCFTKKKKLTANKIPNVLKINMKSLTIIPVPAKNKYLTKTEV